jgi:hypothetical protein
MSAKNSRENIMTQRTVKKALKRPNTFGPAHKFSNSFVRNAEIRDLCCQSSEHDKCTIQTKTTRKMTILQTRLRLALATNPWDASVEPTRQTYPKNVIYCKPATSSLHCIWSLARKRLTMQDFLATLSTPDLALVALFVRLQGHGRRGGLRLRRRH